MTDSMIFFRIMVVAQLLIYLTLSGMIVPARIKQPDIPLICSRLPYMLYRALVVLAPCYLHVPKRECLPKRPKTEGLYESTHLRRKLLRSILIKCSSVLHTFVKTGGNLQARTMVLAQRFSLVLTGIIIHQVGCGGSVILPRSFQRSHLQYIYPNNHEILSL